MVDLPEKNTSPTDVLSGGEMVRLINDFDWSKTSVGAPERWSETLKSVINIMLINRFPMLLWWGKEYIQIYNDAYIPVLGLKHPGAGLGRPGHECWEEIWDVLAPLIDTPFNGGPSTWMQDILLKVNRNNRVEETHFTIAYSPVPDPTAPDGIGGVLATVNEITEEIISKRQMETLRKLGKGISSVTIEEDVYAQVANVLEENKHDIPFAFIHALNDDGSATVMATVGIDRHHPIIQKPVGDGSALFVSNIDDRWTNLPTGAWDLQPKDLIHLPIRNKGKVIAILTIAQSPCRQFDDSYSSFVQLLSDQVSFGISTAKASKLRKESQKAIRNNEEKLRALVNATSDVIYRMSADWKTMIQLDGRSFLKDTGEPSVDWQEQYIHPKDRQRVSQAIQEAIKNRSIFQLEHQVIRNDGTLGWTFSRAVPILDESGEVVEWFGAASDISTRKFYETELEARVEDRTKALNKANSELQVSNEDLQQFAHVASHDLKEPLRKIKTFALRVQEEYDGHLPEKAKVYMDRVLTAADRMSTMIDGVLTYSSLNGGGFMMEVIDLNGIIKNIRADLELMIEQKQATIVSSGLPEVHGGRVLIHQLFYNLINNSLKFSEDDRPPVIRVETYKDKREGKIYDVIRVSDNGIGFDQTQSTRIFETFIRLHSKDQYDGTGLGLALCKKIVERHKGRIWAEGKRDVGATFVIELPSISV